MQGVARRARQNLVDQRAAREAELKMMEADDVRRKAAIASANAAYEAANTAKLEADTVMKQALDALKGVSDDQFAEALKAVLKSNGCVLELEFNSLRNPADFQSILNSLGIGGPISAAAETELKTRSLSTISNLLRNSQVEIGEFSKTIRLKDCN